MSGISLRTFYRVIYWNVALFLVAVGVLFSLAVFITLLQLYTIESIDDRASLPNYAQSEWSKLLFSEDRQLEFEYHSFWEWRTRSFSGKTITVSGYPGERFTSTPPNTGSTLNVSFFGGSTMWGVGSRDIDTIPSFYARASGHKTRNFGERGYTAHQSLEVFLYLERNQPRADVVVFYDGINDILTGCNSDFGPMNHGMAPKIQNAIDEKVIIRPVTHAIQLVHKVIGKIMGKAPHPEPAFQCHQNPALAKTVADNLIEDWVIAKHIVEARNGIFVAFLQPLALLSETRTSHLQLSDIERQQFQAVYPIIESELSKHNFFSLKKTLDLDEFIYIDPHHVSPNGNEILSQVMLKYVRYVLENHGTTL
jgi:hypothetical protein